LNRCSDGGASWESMSMYIPVNQPGSIQPGRILTIKQVSIISHLGIKFY